MIRLHRVGFFILVLLAIVLARPNFIGATTLFDATISNDAACGSGGCFGLTYELIITDAGDSNATTFTGTIIITGTYTGSQSFIAAVDFKPDGNTILSATLTNAPGGTSGWFTAINAGQAVSDCAGAGVGFICSSDNDPNNLAPTGSNLNYTWSWNFTMNGTVDPGHLGVCFDGATDTPGGPCVSISQFGTGPGPGPSNEIPESPTLILLGSGLIVLGGLARRHLPRK